jgi:hypothetical protein
MKLKLACVAALIGLSGSVVLGHQSFAAHYLEEQSVTIEGTLVAFEYRAPHAWVRLAVTGPDGVTQQFGAEWSNPNRLSRDGIGKETLKVGDRLVITGSPGRNPAEHTVHLKRIERPSDGWSWQGRGRRGRRR